MKNEILEETGEKAPSYIIGFAGNNGRVFILNKKDLILKNHSSNEFEKLIVHEFSHIFLRRILNSEKIYWRRWKGKLSSWNKAIYI